MTMIVLASSSPYRGQLLAKLALPFLQASPNIDEQANIGESATQLVKRLSEEKATALATQYPNHLIIGSDQVACLNGEIIGKPLNHHGAKAQLRSFSGHSVEFRTGLCLLNSARKTQQVSVAHFWVHFRTLNDRQIETYLNTEQPYDCAGSFKSEGLGIALFSRLEGDDPNALVGLPLIELCNMLSKEGVDPLQAPTKT